MICGCRHVSDRNRRDVLGGRPWRYDLGLGRAAASAEADCRLLLAEDFQEPKEDKWTPLISA
jgi:hypothetical protein